MKTYQYILYANVISYLGDFSLCFLCYFYNEHSSATLHSTFQKSNIISGGTVLTRLL